MGFTKSSRSVYIALFFGFMSAGIAEAAVGTPLATSDATNRYFKFSYSGSPTFFRVFLDADSSSSTGFSTASIGAEYLIENGALYKFSGSSRTSWAWTKVQSVPFSVSSGSANWTVLKSSLANITKFRIAGNTSSPDEYSSVLNVSDVAPSPTPTPTVTATPTPTATATPTPTATATSLPLISAVTATSASSNRTFKFSYSGAASLLQIYIDSDSASSTGYAYKGIGADYLLENGALYKYSGASQGWGWSQLRTVTFSGASGMASWTITKADIANSTIFKLVGRRTDPEGISAVLSVNEGVIVTPSPTPTATVTPSPTPSPIVVTVPSGSLITVNPAAISTIFNNPERGFHNFEGINTSSSSHAANVSSGSTLALAAVRIPIPVSTPGVPYHPEILPDAFLSQYANMFTQARIAGVKMILLHSYHEIQAFNADPTEAIILSHISQLTPIITANKDVVFTMHSGFIGAWGEWYYTQHGESARRNILRAILNGIPSTMSMALRTPGFKIDMFDMTGPNAPTIDAALAKRVGHHNDCFLASSTDFGTDGGFNLGGDWRDFIASEAKQLSIPVGGETCAPSSYSSCSNTLVQMARQGWSYVNTDYHPDVVNGWKSGGCYDEINRRLGYRLELNQFSIPAEVSKATAFNIGMKIKNSGWAGMVNSRPVKVVLFNASGSYNIDVAQDPKKWIPGTYTFTQAVSLSGTSIPVGDYNVAIWMPDANSGLQSRPGYSVRLANDGWDSAKGWNVVKNGSANIVVKVGN